MRVWLTRSQPGAERQAEALRQAGYQVLVQPVLSVEAVDAVAPPGAFDCVVFLSEHAVRFGLPLVEPGAARIMAVGQRTAEVLSAAGRAVRVPDTATSEGLLAMPELQQLADARILIVCGAGGRGLLAAELTRRGAHVERLVCYRRSPVGKLEIRPGRIDVIVAASGDGVQQVARIWFAAGGSSDVPLLVPSARVADMALALGFVCIHDCAGADAAAVLRTLEALGSMGKT